MAEPLSGLAMLGVGAGLSGFNNALNLSNSLLSGAITRHWNKKDSHSSALLQYDLNKKFNEWLIPYQLRKNFQYAERYAKNGPSWNVEGLRAAGLNPILAASGGFHGGSSPSSSVGSSGGVSAPQTHGSSLPSADIIGAINGIKQNELLDEQIEGEKIKNNNAKKNMGLSGRDATYARIFNEVRSLVGEENFSKLSKGTLDSIKSLFDAPDKYSSLFSFKLPDNRPSSIPDNPVVSEDTPPSMAVYTQHSPKPYYDNRVRPRVLSSSEKARLDKVLRKRSFEELRRKSKKVFYFNEQFDKIPHWRKHLYR